MTKLEIISRLVEIRTRGGGVDYMRGVDNKVGLNKWSLSWYDMDTYSRDDIISFLADKSLTYTLVEIRGSILNKHRYSLIFKESDDYQTNLDADVIEEIAYSLWTIEKDRKWGNDHYPFKK